MKLPSELQAAIDRLTAQISPQALRKAREWITQNYREGRTSQPLFSDEGARLSYLAARLPATYGACYRVLQELRKQDPHRALKKWIDLGAGPGTAIWAAAAAFPEMEEAVLIEKSPSAVQLGQDIGSPVAHRTWVQYDLESLPPLPTGDIAIMSYALGELADPGAFLRYLWNGPYPLVVLIEPGTPVGFNRIRKWRSQLIEGGAHILAPCPHLLPCPMAGSDWCHFSTRVERTKLHRLLKEGSLGYEDEKFSYLIASHSPPPSPQPPRILRHPQKGSGHVRFSLCTPEGTVAEQVISRRDRERYKRARDLEWGDSF